MKYLVTKEDTLLNTLGQLAPESSRTTLRSWLKDGRVVVDGYVVKIGATVVSAGQMILVGEKPRFISDTLRIYHQDRHLVVIEKPAGLLSVSTDFDKTRTVHTYLKKHFHPSRVFVVHRLDQDTSGVMLFALTEQARDALKLMFEKHDLERRYTAIVEGHIDSLEGKWESYIYEDEQYMVHSTTDPTQGRLAVTYYSVKAVSKHQSLLELTLHTGRKNQIRVHCQDAGHPIVGDKKYGAKTNPHKRLCLHAHFLGFKHPITQKMMQFESTLPKLFSEGFS